jgi:hypothetical protein
MGYELTLGGIHCWLTKFAYDETYLPSFSAYGVL